MATLPTTGDDLDLVSFTVETQPSDTYKLDIEHDRGAGHDRRAGCSAPGDLSHPECRALRLPHLSRSYGSELTDLIGKPKDYAMSEIKRRITEALLQDDRITAVDSWEFETGRNWVLARFVAHTIFGEVEAEKEVAI